MTNSKDPRPLEGASLALLKLEGVLNLVSRVSPDSPMIKLISWYLQQLKEDYNHAEKEFMYIVYEGVNKTFNRKP